MRRRSLAAFALLLVIGGCGPRMEDQPSLEAYEAEMPPMPEGTVARAGGDPVPGDEAAGLANPFAPTPANLARGAALFATYCTPCHGPGGRGDGTVGKKLGVEVRDLTGDHVAALADGEIFATITRGNGAMLGLRGLVARDERWLIVLHVRALGTASPAAEPPPGR